MAVPPVSRILAALAALWLLTPSAHAEPEPGELLRCAAGASRRTAAPITGAPITGAPTTGVPSRGVNLTTALDPATGMAQVEQDLRAIRQLGLRHVRLPIRPDWVLTWPASGAPDPSVSRLDAVVCAALRQDLAIILDLHPAETLALRDGAGDDVVARLAAAWDRLARRYAVIPPGSMVFEALNEPVLTDPRRWDRDLRILLDHIRRAAPRHLVVLTGSPFGSAIALTSLTPVRDANVAYAFHVYSPIVFTHQGADWTLPDQRSIRGLVYPATAGNVGQVEAGADPGLQPALAQYLAGFRGPGAIRSEIDQVARWAERNRVRLVVTEFGVYGAADLQSRSAWLHDVAAALEARHIGWTLWEYRGGFGIDQDQAGPCRASASVRGALHLCPAPAGRR